MECGALGAALDQFVVTGVVLGSPMRSASPYGARCARGAFDQMKLAEVITLAGNLRLDGIFISEHR